MAGKRFRYVQFDWDVSTNTVIAGSVTHDQGDGDRAALAPNVWRIMRDVSGKVFVRAASPKIPTGSTFAGGVWDGEHVAERWCSPPPELDNGGWQRLEEHIKAQVAFAESMVPQQDSPRPSAPTGTGDPLTEPDPMKALAALEARLATGQDPWASSVTRQPASAQPQKKRSFWQWFTGQGVVPCPDCGRDVSRTAKACPGCGRPF